MSMDKEKRERIINASMKEFLKGYNKSSTDVIVKEAHISKGLLFHYFNTKKDLFIFLYHYSINIITREFLSKANLKEPDILIRLWNMIKLKIELTYHYPDIFNFLIQAQYYTQELNEEFNKEFHKIIENMSIKLYSNIDTSAFKDNYDIQKVVNVINWTLKSYSETLIINNKDISNYHSNIDNILKEIEEYISFFRKILYKEEYLNGNSTN